MSEFLNFLIVTPAALLFFVGILGLCVGSFLNVIIHRTPKIMEQQWQTECQMLLHPEQPVIDVEKLTLSYPASHCPQCQIRIRWYQNIPLLSWFMLRGQCAHCR
ncbi:MAG: prepilin peptidase, partial [Acinetobacter sp.]